MTSNNEEVSLRVRINQIDYTLGQPGPLDNSSLPRVPIIRIYGNSSYGKKACVHVHQVYPYFFIEYRGKISPDSVHRYIAKLTLSLNHAIAISMKRNPHSPNSQFVRAIVLVKGVHFYGFHHSYCPFLKIHIADPAFLNRAVTIMQSGTVMQTRFHIFESHLSYILQFLCDFGLYGCGWLDLGEVWLRGREDEEHEHELLVREGEAQVTYKPSPYFRQTQMPVEFDVAAHQILNRHALSPRDIHHKFEIPAPPLPSEPLVISVRELWEDQRRRRIANGLPPSPSIPVDPSESSRDTGGEWVAEARWWDEIRKRIERDRGTEVIPSDSGWARWVMTTFESLEALWEPEHKTWRPKKADEDETTEGQNRTQQDTDEVNPFENATLSQTWTSDAGDGSDIDVDEQRLSSQEISQLVLHDEREWAEEGEEGKAASSGEEDENLHTAEDDPPADAQISDLDHYDDTSKDNNTRSPPRTPQRTSVKRVRPFQDAWRQLIGHARDTTSSSAVLATPTKIRTFRAKSPASPSPLGPKQLLTFPETASRPQAEFWRQNELLRAAQELEGPKFHLSGNMNRAMAGDVPPIPSNLIQSESLEECLHSVDDTLQPSVSQEGGNSREKLPSDNHFASERPFKRRKTSHQTDGEVHPSTVCTFSSPTSSKPMSIDGTNDKAIGRVSRHIGVSHIGPNVYLYDRTPPATSVLLSTVDDYGIPSKIYRDPYYSKEIDVPERSREYAGLVYRLKGGEGLVNLEQWRADSTSNDEVETHEMSGGIALDRTGVGGWEYASCPPSVREVKRWLKESGKMMSERHQGKSNSQIEGPTQANIYGLKTTPVKPSDAARREQQKMTILSLEVFALSRRDFVPDPDVDEIVAVFYSFRDDEQTSSEPDMALRTGIIAVDNAQFDPRRLREFSFDVVPTELDLLNRVADQVLELDPDILVGWDAQAASWGYLNIRGRSYGFDVGELISRAPARYMADGGNNQWGLRTTSTFRVIGRHVLNLWRIMRTEQNLSMYTFENVIFHVLRRRVPHYSSRTLTSWFRSDVPAHTARALQYFIDRTSANLEVLEEAEVVTKTAEFARIFGVDFFSVISRGSQFKVESFMFRIAKPESFVLLSPSKQDVGKQNAAECMPLIMEPLSAFYNSPLVVLDFQSLYPSIMIAYNYCYSTCLGRITDFKGRNKFGVSELNLNAGLLDTLQEHINVAPNGIMYVKPSVRRGLLGRMLTELLETRVMVKQAMKSAKGDKMLKRVLDARQLGLKYIANVTYGYTSATYSGRMPAVEIADSIVQSGRETLEKAVRIIDATKKWGAKVVYGDTDSLFIYLRGKTKEQAFRIGYDISETITRMNPVPIKLKFEKVYLPCVLMAKKRYVGFKYENPDDKEPVFDAKGIETVRRDGVPAQQKMLENCLKILFRSQDLSEVKGYCCRSWSKILDNKISIQDFIFAKEVKMGTYSDKVPPPPGATVAARRMMEDQNDEPQYGERVPYVIVRGGPHARLVDRAVAPQELFDQQHLRLDAAYYISRVLIPPLERIFNLVGADVRSWYEEMPKSIRADPVDPIMLSPKKIKKDGTVFNRLKIDEHFHSSQCIICGTLTSSGLCDVCRMNPQPTIAALLSRIRKAESRLKQAHEICGSCTRSSPAEPILCDSLDCPWLFERKRAQEKAEGTSILQELIDEVEIQAFSESEHEIPM